MKKLVEVLKSILSAPKENEEATFALEREFTRMNPSRSRQRNGFSVSGRI